MRKHLYYISILLCSFCFSQNTRVTTDATITKKQIGYVPANPIPVDTIYLNEKLAFPDATGYGKYAGVSAPARSVYRVTTLLDDGPGSFREAVIQPNRDVVFFGLSGNIALESSATRISIPANVRILGQTGNVAITSSKISDSPHNELFALTGGNSVVRYLRIRRHGEKPDLPSASGAIMLNGGNYIWDHVSVSGATDDLMSGVYGDGGGNTTFQNCMIYWSIHKSYSLDDNGDQDFDNPQIPSHSKGFLAAYGNVSSLSFKDNVLAHLGERNPAISTYTVDMNFEMVNNIIYNWGSIASTIRRRPSGNQAPANGGSGPASATATINANYIGNAFIKGNDTFSNRPALLADNFGVGGLDLYFKNNFSDKRINKSTSEDDIARTGYYGSLTTLPSSMKSSSIFSMNYGLSDAIDPINVSATALKDYLLPKVGPYIYRDSNDAEIISDVISNGSQGSLISSYSDTRLNYPTLSGMPSFTDANGNWIDDSFESEYGLSGDGTGTTVNWTFGSVTVINNAGYTDREMYWAWLAKDFEQ